MYSIMDTYKLVILCRCYNGILLYDHNYTYI